MRCEDPVKIIEILRLWEQGLSQREIALSVKCGKTTVGEIQRRCRETGLGFAEAERLTNDAIRERLYPGLASKGVKAEPEWNGIHTRLLQNRRLNLQYVWEEYRQTAPEGLGYSQFCRRYNLWRERTGKEVEMAQEREPGRELYVDWMGDTLYCVRSGSEMIAAHFFVATLGDSSYPYVEAFPDEGQMNWLTAHVHALEWFGGVPRIFVPDNLKAAVNKPNRYDPKLNPAYCELARHYGVAVIPARIRRPRDKSPVESGVGWLETWLLEWLRGQQFFSFEELNAAIRKRLKELVLRLFQKRAGSRASVFEKVDKPALRPLPAARYEYAEFAFRRVPDNYHVEYDEFYYSVPYTLHRQQVTLRVTGSMVEVINANRERVALHPRRRSGSRYVTLPAHMPKNHQHRAEFNRRDGDSYRQWAATAGENTVAVIDALLKAQHAEESAYRSCMGLLQLGRKHGNDRLETACRTARGNGRITYAAVKQLILNPPTPPLSHSPLPAHENLRSPAEFM